MCGSVYEEVAFMTQSHSSALFLCAVRMHHVIKMCGSFLQRSCFQNTAPLLLFVLTECIIRLNCVVLSRMHFKIIDFFKYWIHVRLYFWIPFHISRQASSS